VHPILSPHRLWPVRVFCCRTAPGIYDYRMRAMRFVQLIIGCGFLSQIAWSAEPHIDLPKALAAAKAKGKPVFIYVYDSI